MTYYAHCCQNYSLIIHTAESLEDKECPKVSIIIQGKEVDNEIV